jgi:UDP-glucose 4-epimerase
MVIPRFVRAALHGAPLRVYGDGQQTRSFTYVGDTVRALIALLDQPRAVGQIVNIGNPEEVTIAELAQRVVRLTGSSSPIITIPYEQAYEAGFEDMRRRVPSIDKLASLTGFEPSLDLGAILQTVIDFERATPGSLLV